MTGLDYSQKRLLSKTLHSKHHDRRTRRLQIYAVLTGFLSMLVSLASLLVFMRL